MSSFAEESAARFDAEVEARAALFEAAFNDEVFA